MQKTPVTIWKEALFFGLTAWGAELVFLRVTGDPQMPLAVFLPLFAYAVMTGPLMLLSERFAPSSKRRYTTPLAASIPALVVCSGYPYLEARKYLSPLVAVSCAMGVLVVGAVLFAVFRRKRAAMPPGWQVVALVALSSLLTAAIRMQSAPPLGIISALLAGWGLLALAHYHRYTMAAALSIVIVASMLPGAPFSQEVRWRTRAPVGKGPDILLIVVDTLRADVAKEMAVYRRLSANGVAHAQTQSAAPWTLPSIASIFTGEVPHVHGAVKDAELVLQKIRSDITTLPVRLSKMGYDCAGVVSNNPNVSPRYGFKKGFSVYDVFGSYDRGFNWPFPRHFGAKPVVVRAVIAHQSWLIAPFVWKVLDWLPLHPDADYLVDKSLRFMKERREYRPLFFFLHLMDPHLPYRHAHGADLSFHARRVIKNAGYRKVRRAVFWQTEAKKEWLRIAYTREVAVVDNALMRFLDALGPPGPRGRVVVLTSDHGEEFFEHGGVEHGHSFFQELLHVPLVVAGLPKSNHLGHTSPDRVVGLVDLAPALIEAAGGPPPEKARHAYVAENPLYGPAPTYKDRNADDWAVRKGDLKAIERGGDMRLFNLRDDPDEKTELKNVSPPVLEAVRTHRPGSTAKGVPVQLTEQERQALQRLGYMSSE
jgi:arylsulfatase A-like enzyme